MKYFQEELKEKVFTTLWKTIPEKIIYLNLLIESTIPNGFLALNKNNIKNVIDSNVNNNNNNNNTSNSQINVELTQISDNSDVLSLALTIKNEIMELIDNTEVIRNYMLMNSPTVENEKRIQTENPERIDFRFTIFKQIK